MTKKNKPQTLNWLEFQALGNPENAPDDIDESQEKNESIEDKTRMKVRVYLERKNRGGKKVSIIKGLDLSDDALKTLCKQLKSKCGIGGHVKYGEIILQGDQRSTLVSELKSLGYTDTKNAGA